MTKPENPYLAAREADESRFGSFAARESIWRYCAFLFGAIALGSVATNAWMVQQPKQVPWPILYDSLGRVMAAGFDQQVTDKQMLLLKRTVMQDLVINLRSVTTDGIAQKGYVDRVYAHLAEGSPAQHFVNEYYSADPPFQRASKEIVGVEVKSVLPISDKTYMVEWIETTRDLYGAITKAEQWKGSFTVAVSTGTDEKIARLNPLGMFIVQCSWNTVPK